MPRIVLSTTDHPDTAGDHHVQIGDLCRALAEVGPQLLLVSPESRIFRTVEQSTTTAPSKDESHDTVDLRQFLLEHRNLSPKDKLSFSLSIASSLLQLNLTPWICKCWTKDDILLRRETSADSGYDIACPLIRGRFEKSTNCQRSDDDLGVALLELGILLVEIWTEQTFESHVESTGRAISELSDPALRRGLLYDWLREMMKKAPPNYCQVVQTCAFSFGFGEVIKSWDDVQFKALYYTNIVEPLSRDLEQLLQMP
ncbi:MAG: hypothetical protein Q9204_002435 [Flavoplaca sp. TL-2023a]